MNIKNAIGVPADDDTCLSDIINTIIFLSNKLRDKLNSINYNPDYNNYKLKELINEVKNINTEKIQTNNTQ